MEADLRAPTARSLVLDLLSTMAGRAIPVRALVAAGQLFGLAENSMRVALARLLAARRIERSARGAYRMGPGAEPIQAHVVGWRRLEERVGAWRGRWLAVYTAALPRQDRTARRRAEQALRFLGFESIEEGLQVRPDNLRDGVAGTRARLLALGLDAAAPVFVAGEFDATTEARARDLWDAGELLDGYRASHSALDRSLAALPALPVERAMVESFLIGGRVLRQLALDPLLPDEIVPTAERTELVSAMRAYDRTGRAAWAGFMRPFGLSRARTSLDTRVAHTAEQLAPQPGAWT